MDMYTVQTDESEYILVGLNPSPKVVVSLLYEGGKLVMERENEFDLIKGNVSQKLVHTSGAVNASVARFTFTNPIGKAHSIAIAFAGAGTWKKLSESTS